MKLTTAIFDMDGLMIDSEPLWYEATMESLATFGIYMDEHLYYESTGLRIRECLQHWFNVYGIDGAHLLSTETDIIKRVIQKVNEKGVIMDGVENTIGLCKNAGLKIGLASSSPLSLINAVLDKTGLGIHFKSLASAEHLPYGKPNPQVFIDCATALDAHPLECMCFEDSFNGLIAAKAARMQCVVVPLPAVHLQSRWDIADLKLKSLADFNSDHLNALMK